MYIHDIPAVIGTLIKIQPFLDRLGNNKNIEEENVFFQSRKRMSHDHRNPWSYTRRSIFEKRENFFQLISTLFCEVKTSTT
jgi:hypothetical protein